MTSLCGDLNEGKQLPQPPISPPPPPCGQVALLRQELDGHFFVTCEQVLRVMDCFEVGQYVARMVQRGSATPATALGTLISHAETTTT